MDFSFSFDGEKVTMDNLTIRLFEDINALVTGLPQQGEIYFKTKQFKEKY